MLQRVSCTGCNQTLLVSASSEECPVCGSPVPIDVTTAATPDPTDALVEGPEGGRSLLREIFSPVGRFNRARYFRHIFFGGVITTLSVALASMTDVASGPITFGILGLGMWAHVAAVIKRLHDLERPAWHYCLLVIPVYNLYLGCVAMFVRGTYGPNRYGEDPLAADYDDPDTVFAAATAIEMSGDWQRAMDLYSYVLERWPVEHGQYAENCIKRIHERSVLAGN